MEKQFLHSGKLNIKLKKNYTIFYIIINRSNIKRRLKSALQNDRLKVFANKILSIINEMIKIGENQPTILEAGARDFAISLSTLFVASILLENASILNAYSNAEFVAIKYISIFRFLLLLS